jgi:hypothetical protein
VVEEDRNARIELILGLSRKNIYISLGKMYVFFFIYSFGFN